MIVYTDKSGSQSAGRGCGGCCDPEDIEDGVSDHVADHVEDEAHGEAGHHAPHPFLGLSLGLWDAPDLEDVSIHDQGHIGVLSQAACLGTANKENTSEDLVLREMLSEILNCLPKKIGATIIVCATDRFTRIYTYFINPFQPKCVSIFSKL